MKLLRSHPGAHRALRRSDWLLALAAAWLAPVALGLVVIVLHMAVSSAVAHTGAPLVRMTSYFLATALIISPAFTWIGLAVSLPAVLGLLARGWFGWLPALLTGGLAGAIAAALLGGAGSAVGPSLGILGAILFRSVLRARRPELF